MLIIVFNINRFNYTCPDLYNRADFVISILNSDDDKVKTSIDAMCQLSSTENQINLNYNLFNNEVNYFI